MARARRSVLSTVAVPLVAAALVPVAAGAEPGAAASTCQGKPVTIVATTTVRSGTEGDDVVAMTPSGWSEFDALGGDDTICLTLPAPSDGGGFTQWRGGLEAGSGDDVVVNQPSPDADAELVVGLGPGADTYSGSDAHETIWAETEAHVTQPLVQPGDQRDLVDTGTGRDSVTTGDPEGTVNEDRIRAAGDIRIEYRGTMGATGALDVTGARLASLTFDLPPAPAAGGTGLVVDNPARAVRLDGTPVLTWSGDIPFFTLQRPFSAEDLPVSFVGTDVSEYVTIAGGPVRDVHLGGQDDHLVIQSGSDGGVPRLLDAGPGNDHLTWYPGCYSVTVRIAESAACDEIAGASGVLRGLEGVGVEVGGGFGDVSGEATVIGTAAGDGISVGAGIVTIKGLGGPDGLRITNSTTARVLGGDGDDRISAYGVDAVLRGEAGADHLVLHGPYTVGGETTRHHAFGGRGADLLRGTSERRGDRLIGGRGRDRAYGSRGRRDVCRAEEKRGCEK